MWAATAAQIDKTGAKALLRSLGILGTCIKEAPEFGGRRRHADAAETLASGSAVGRAFRLRLEHKPMSDFSVRSDSVDVEQIMRQIRARIREKRGVDYTEDEIRELANVKLEKFLDPRGVRSDLLEQFRQGARLVVAAAATSRSRTDALRVAAAASCVCIRKLLQPILKLFFNPNPLIEALHIQSKLNDSCKPRSKRSTTS